MAETLRLSTGHEVQIDFESSKWRSDVRHLARTIIGERLHAASSGDGPVAADDPWGRVEAAWLEECRYLCATADERFKTMLMAAVIWDAIVGAWRPIEEKLRREAGANPATGSGPD